MRYFFQAIRPLAEDLLSTIFFVALYATTHDIVLSVSLGGSGRHRTGDRHQAARTPHRCNAMDEPRARHRPRRRHAPHRRSALRDDQTQHRQIRHRLRDAEAQLARPLRPADRFGKRPRARACRVQLWLGGADVHPGVRKPRRGHVGRICQLGVVRLDRAAVASFLLFGIQYLVLRRYIVRSFIARHRFAPAAAE